MSARIATTLGTALCLLMLATQARAQAIPLPAVPPPAAAETTAAPPAATTGTESTPQPTAADVTSAEPAAASTATAPPATTADPHPTWTSADIARVRAMLVAARQAREAPPPSTPPPAPKRVYGDAGGPFAIGLGIDAVFYADKGYGLYSDRNATARFSFWLGYDVLSLSDRLILTAELGIGSEHASRSDLFGHQLRTQLDTQTLTAASSLRWVLFPWLQPHARLAVGGSTLSMSFDTTEHDHDHALSPFGSLGAGFLLRTPTRSLESQDGRFSSLSFGLLFEAGYSVRGPVDFALEHGGDHQIKVVAAKLGTLSLSGPYIRTGLVVRF